MTKTRKLTECAIMVALAAVLSMIKVYNLPLGGSVTLLSMLPICIISVRHGVRTGLFTAFLYSCIQFAFGILFDGLLGWGMTPDVFAGCVVFDYLVPFTVLGLAGVFKKEGTGGIVAGTVMVLVLRFVSHLISGTIFFDIWCPEGWASPFIYSVCYNGSYMLPELIFTVAGFVILMRVEQFKKLLYDKMMK